MRGADPDGVPPPIASPVYGPPVKRSVTIAGHQTAISLEPLFWAALRAAAAADGLPVNALIARIDVERMAADDPPSPRGHCPPDCILTVRISRACGHIPAKCEIDSH
jgi:hypothetical protein